MRDVQHQPRAHRVIQRALASRRIPHAYLFAGPDGVGKEMMALGLAQTMLCSQPVQMAESAESGNPALLDACNECQDCLLVKAGTHPDLSLIYRQLNRQSSDSTVRKQKALLLVVDVVREFLIERAGNRPSRGRARVFIVREADRMNDAAQNSLLKTLEEPPKSTFIILLTSAIDRMLPTTRSRCQQVAFSSLPDAFVVDQLERLRPDATPAARLYAGRRAGGSLGAALRQIDDDLITLKGPWGGKLMDLSRGGRGFAPTALAKPFSEDAKVLAKLVAERDPDVSDTDSVRAGLQTMLGVLGDFHLDALRLASGASLAAINADQPEVAAELARHGPAALAAGLRALSEADHNLSRNANIDLTLETLFISLARATRETMLV